ncbi:MAG: DUF1351 domain-containing protein [Dorea sp.]|nr:DUF1351 domain-containing protein [Dorea sp.]
MEELTKVAVQYTPATITDNLEAVKDEVVQLCNDYSSIVITEENLKDGTEALAIIRAKKNDIETERKAIKKDWNAPYLAWESKVKEITGICDQAIADISAKMEGYEQKRLEEKNQIINNIWEQIQKEFPEACEYLTIGEISSEPTGQKTGAKYLRDKWLTKTYEIPKIRKDIEGRITIVAKTLDRIRDIHSKYEAEALRTFKQTKEFSEAVATIRAMEEHERQVLEAERKRREEEERQRAIREAEAERRRQEEVERQKRLLEEAQERERRAKEEAALAEQRRREEEAARKEAEKHSIKIQPKKPIDDWDWDDQKAEPEKMYKFLCLVPESVKNQLAQICDEYGLKWQAKEAEE